jgi:hypothetical protein
MRKAFGKGKSAYCQLNGNKLILFIISIVQ